MNFYDDWEKCIDSNYDDSYYINSFLYKSSDSIEPLYNSSKKHIKKVIEFLVNYDKSKILDLIDRQHQKLLQPSDVAQFSNFEKSTDELTHILVYEENGLTFEDLGYLLIKAPTKMAATKYGENQSKTAKIFELVSFSTSRPIEVTNTILGNEFPYLDDETKIRLLSILVLRDPVVIHFICEAKYKVINYKEILNCLSNSTRERRKSNIKRLIELAFYEEKKEYKNNIEI